MLLFLSLIPGALLVNAPSITILPLKGRKFDYQNESVTVLTNSNPGFDILCSANFPVQWTFHFGQEDDGNMQKAINIETNRNVVMFEDFASYTFSSRLRFDYKGKLLSLTNFSCHVLKLLGKNSENPSKHVIMSKQKRKSLLVLHNTSNFVLSNNSITPSENANCTNAVATMVLPPNSLSPCWKCESLSPRKELEIDIESCDSPTKCSNIYSSENQGNLCLKRVGDYTGSCTLSENIDFNPKLLLCKNFGPTLTHTYFYGVFRGDFEDENVAAPPIYTDWTEADPQQMLYIHPIKTKHLYQGEQVKITCEYSRYYFALGSWFGVMNGSKITYIAADDTKPCFGNKEEQNPSKYNCTKDSYWRGTYRAELQLELKNTGFYEVFCFGPIWNSTEWINASLKFSVDMSEKSRIRSLQPRLNMDFHLGQQFRKLICKYSGKPIPTVTWTWTTTQATPIIRQVDNYTSELIFPEISYSTAGKYTCTVQNCGGSDTMSFEIEPANVMVFAVIAISLIVVVFVMAEALVYNIRVIKSQNKRLRCLSKAEVREFVHGNPQKLRAIGDGYFSQKASLEALPYEQKYEISSENVTIYTFCELGSGEYGRVFKGKVRVSKIHGSPKTTSALTDLEEVEVAVKICKVNLDVIKFKALLTEIKVMGHLGVHKNIVNLIGASTKNIVNRELSIIVEYCPNGSLDVFLRNNKEQFIPVNAKNSIYENSLKVDNLYNWASEIADGLEYIHEKRIIHGDLAIRNVLLTANLTVKIGDFGLSRQLVDTYIYTKKTNCALPWRNMAIESLRKLEFTTKSDMWAFGVTLWEMFALGDVPYPGLNYNPEFSNLLEQGLRLNQPLLSNDAMYAYMQLCWNTDPSLRPTPSGVKTITMEAVNKTVYMNML